MGDLAKAPAESGGGAPASVGTPGQPVPAPAAQYKAVNGGQVFSAQVPANWTSIASRSSVKAVPQNGYGQINGQTVFTHGVEFGVAQAGSRDLREATDAWLRAVAQGNPGLEQAGTQQVIRLSGRTALRTLLSNPSATGGRERIGLYTTFLVDGTLFYCVTIVPDGEAATYAPVFQRVANSIRLADAR